MGNDRKIVFIIGNGFDLNLGRKTSYKDFWESDFCPKNYPAPIIKHLNSKWPDSKDSVKWYDMENELLHYYDGFGSSKKPKDVITEKEKKFISIFKPGFPSSPYLSSYLTEIESLAKQEYIHADWPNYENISIPYQEDIALSAPERDRKAFQKIKLGLCQYLQSISQLPIEDGRFAVPILFAMTEAIGQGNTLNIYNFNYTDLPYHYNSDFESIIHYVHGRFKDNNIIVGTKDDKELGENYDFLQKSFDTNFNPPAIVYDLLDADDVVIFGHSLGVNDSQYFKPFFKQQSSPINPIRKRITIFTWDEKSEIEIKRSLQQMTDYNFSLLRSLNDFQIIKICSLFNNANLFKSFLSRYISNKQTILVQVNNIKETQ